MVSQNITSEVRTSSDPAFGHPCAMRFVAEVRRHFYPKIILNFSAFLPQFSSNRMHSGFETGLFTESNSCGWLGGVNHSAGSVSCNSTSSSKSVTRLVNCLHPILKILVARRFCDSCPSTRKSNRFTHCLSSTVWNPGSCSISIMLMYNTEILHQDSVMRK